MNLNEFLNLTKKKWRVIFISTVFFILLAALFTFLQPLKYEAKSKLILIPVLTTKDPYALAKANEYLSNILSQAATSNLFFNQVIESEFKIDKSYFGSDLSSQMKIWSKTIFVKPISDTGIIEVSVFHKNKDEADKISQAASFIFKTKNNLFHEDNVQVNVRVLDRPIVSTWPVKPNILLNFILALGVGLALSSIYIYLAAAETGSELAGGEGVREIADDIDLTPNRGLPFNQRLSQGVFGAVNGFAKAESVSFLDIENRLEPDQVKQIQENEETIATTDEDRFSRNDDLDLEYVLASGSMANIFGRSKMEN